MGKKKVSKGTHYVSKSINSNVSKKTLNLMRKMRQGEFNAKAYDARVKYETIMSKKSKEYAKKLMQREIDRSLAQDLYEQYAGRVDWSACVRAVKEKSVPEFQIRYKERLAKG